MSCVVMTLGLAVIAHADPPRYTVTLLDDPPTALVAQPTAMNASGEVTGSIFNAATGFFDGAVWDSDGNGEVLSNLYGGLDIAQGTEILDDGTILGAGTENAATQVLHAAILAPDGSYSILPSLEPDNGVVSVAFDTNDAEIIVGRSALIPTPNWQSVPNDAVIWEDGEITSIGTLGGFYAEARGINNNNIIFGISNTATSDLARGFVWDETNGMQEIIPLKPGALAFFSDMNDNDLLVGTSPTDPAGSNYFACIWHDYTEPPETLELLHGDINNAAHSINNHGEIVGRGETAQGDRARLWIDGEAHDLNALLDEPLGVPLTSAGPITDNGLILARAEDPAGGFIDVVLTPEASCPSDLDGSGDINVEDLLLVLNAWGECPRCEDCTADITGDCAVDVDDLLIVLGNWGPCD